MLQLCKGQSHQWGPRQGGICRPCNLPACLCLEYGSCVKPEHTTKACGHRGLMCALQAAKPEL